MDYEVTQFTGDCSATEFSPRLTLHNIDEADVQILWSTGDTGLETTWNLKDELTLTIKNDCQQITEFFSPDILESNDIYPHTNVFEGQVYDTQELVESIFSKYSGPRLRGITISDRMGRLVLYLPNTGDDIPLEKIANASIESGLYLYSLDLIAITCNKDSEIRRTGKFIVFRN